MTEQEYQDALAEIEPLIELDPYPSSPEGQRLLELADAIQAYEAGFPPLTFDGTVQVSASREVELPPIEWEY